MNTDPSPVATTSPGEPTDHAKAWRSGISEPPVCLSMASVLAGIAVFALATACAATASVPHRHRIAVSTEPTARSVRHRHRIAVSTEPAARSVRHRHRIAAPTQPTAAGKVPAYYIAATGAINPPYTSAPRSAGIYATATGALVAPLMVPAGHWYVDAVSAAADDRSFLYAVENGAARPRIYLARFNPGTGKVSYATVPAPFPARTELGGLAISPDATKIAYAFRWGIFQTHCGLTILDVRTGRSRTWTSSDRSAGADGFDNFEGYPLSVSWANDNRTVAFNWFAMVPVRDYNQLVNSGLRLVDTVRPGHRLIADSRLAVRYVLRELKLKPDGRSYLPATSAGYLSGVAILTPDGRTVVAGLRTYPTGRDGEFASFSASTGQLKRIVDRKRAASLFLSGGMLQVLWASADGRTLIVINPPGHPGRIAVVRGRQLALLRQPPKIVFPLAAW